MDSSESPTYGEQEASTYNGHFGCTCYHPPFVFNQLGDVERCALRPGSVPSADGRCAVLAGDRGALSRMMRQTMTGEARLNERNGLEPPEPGNPAIWL
jgi:hypothetical protein